MDRLEFLKRASAFGLGSALLPSFLTACETTTHSLPGEFDVYFDGKVIIIGAGAAGLTAGHVLNQHGIDFTILEAAPQIGGRMRETSTFADFSVDLGAEWIHTDPSILARMLNDPDSTAEVDIINYRPQEIYAWINGKLRRRNWVSHIYAEHKFKSSGWFDFFNTHIVPGIADRIQVQSPVAGIDYRQNLVRVETGIGQVFEASRVILTVPVPILQDNDIRFLPEFPQEKIDAINEVDMPGGLKIFFEFDDKFYPDIVYDGSFIANEFNSDSGEKIYYDAAFRKDSNRNIFALFTVGDKSDEYTSLQNDQAIADAALAELDEFFDGKASRHYVKHIVQNWSAEPFIRGSYTHDTSSDIQRTLRRPIENKIFFAGETYAEDWATVHGAAMSAYDAVEEILANREA